MKASPLACISFAIAAVISPIGAKSPNILFIMADDLGWMDLACQGNPLVETPNLDRLAKQGMRFTDAYAAAPVCSPTRCAVLTGQAPARIGLTTHLPGRFFPKDGRPQPAKLTPQLNTEHVTIAERMKEAGYASAFFGKWHIAPSSGRGGKVADAVSPTGQGFDLNVGGTSYGGPPSFFSPYRNAELPDGTDGEYLPDRLVDETIRFAEANKDKPWMAHLWFYTVHWPMQAPKDLLEKYADRKGPGLNDTRYGAMIEAMDLAIGRLLEALKKMGLKKDTLVIFTSDNGGFAGVSDCRPLRESKGHLYEGGIRVPLIVGWPGQVPQGKLCKVPVTSMDFYPTFLELAGLKPSGKPIDGESLLPLFRQTGKLSRKTLYFHFPNYAWHMGNRLAGAVREGKWKMIRNYDDGSLELYDLQKDLSEKRNLAKKSPQVANRLNQKLSRWLKETNAPMPTLNSKPKDVP
ncbi:MAG: sulfatase [Opitutae bacterium]|nr:sulfatase [Opitutae bacterium]MBT7741895.1 sulfatase [Opitutae bacterium]